VVNRLTDGFGCGLDAGIALRTPNTLPITRQLGVLMDHPQDLNRIPNQPVGNQERNLDENEFPDIR
jgi:hypothetical protein